MRYAGRVWTLRGIPNHRVAFFRGATHFLRGERGQWLTRMNASGTEKVFKALTREYSVDVDWILPGIRDRHPRISRDKHNGMRTSDPPQIANRYGSSTFF
jgi:hypothetical protein